MEPLLGDSPPSLDTLDTDGQRIFDKMAQRTEVKLTVSFDAMRTFREAFSEGTWSFSHYFDPMFYVKVVKKNGQDTVAVLEEVDQLTKLLSKVHEDTEDTEEFKSLESPTHLPLACGKNGDNPNIRAKVHLIDADTLLECDECKTATKRFFEKLQEDMATRGFVVLPPEDHSPATKTLKSLIVTPPDFLKGTVYFNSALYVPHESGTVKDHIKSLLGNGRYVKQLFYRSLCEQMAETPREEEASDAFLEHFYIVAQFGAPFSAAKRIAQILSSEPIILRGDDETTSLAAAHNLWSFPDVVKHIRAYLHSVKREYKTGSFLIDHLKLDDTYDEDAAAAEATKTILYTFLGLTRRCISSSTEGPRFTWNPDKVAKPWKNLRSMLITAVSGTCCHQGNTHQSRSHSIARLLFRTV